MYFVEPFCLCLRYFYKLDLQREDIARAGGIANMKSGGKVDYDNYLPDIDDDK